MASVLQEWLHPISGGDFRRRFLGINAWARPGAARAQVDLCSWKSIGRLLRSADTRDVLVVARGRLLALPAPRDLKGLRGLMHDGVGVCLRRVEDYDPPLAALARSLGSSFGAPSVRIQVFATPGGTHGFGWHYDAEEVFIVQTAGTKDYYFRKNTVEARRSSSSTPDFSGIRAETSPLQTARLIAGCLYIPARWWHMAHCREDSLSISLGARAGSACT